MKIAQRLDQLQTENAFEVLAEVKRLTAEGRHIISFAIGEPDFDTPENIKAAGIRAIAENQTHYSPAGGIPQLKQAIASYIKDTRQISVGPPNIVVTPGAKPIILYSLLACVNPGDEVIYPNPGFPIYQSAIGFIGAKGIPLPIREDLGFSFDPDEFKARVTPRTRMVILNSPHNPTGGVLRTEALEAVVEAANKYDLWVLSDEIYSRIIYEEPFKSIASIPGMVERTIIIDGFSKTYAMTGWRIGYGVMPAQLAHWVTRIQINNESCVSTFTQFAATEALIGSQDGADAIVREFARRRKMMVEELNRVPGIKCPVPAGTFYVYPNVTGACRRLGLKDSKELQRRLLYGGNVAVLAGSAFGSRNDEQEYIRLSYATSEENIREGIHRIKKVLQG
ncbi:aspartate aminotransferase [Clostridiales bacterium PH28_bin88]|nr:aspartate aminotransferase [Clostridiales bacterium PH28_bin88]